MSGDGGCDAVAEGLEADIGILLHRDAFMTVGSDRRFRQAAAANCRSGWRRNAPSVHPLLVESLQIPHDLGDHPDQLTRNVRDILLCQLPLLSPAGRRAERRLELRDSKLCTEVLPEILSGSAVSELTEAAAALHRCVLQLRLALQHSDDLRHDGQELPYHFIDILLAEQSRRLAVGGISASSVRRLCLRQDLRQGGHQLTHHLPHILLRKLTLLLAAPLRLLLLAPALGSLGLRTPPGAGSIPTDGWLAAILAVLLAKGCLSQPITSEPVTAGMRGVRIERRPLLGIELWVVLVLLLGIEVGHRCFSLAMVGAPQPNTDLRTSVSGFAPGTIGCEPASRFSDATIHAYSDCLPKIVAALPKASDERRR